MPKPGFVLKRSLFYLIVIIYILLLAKVLLFKYLSPIEIFSVERIIMRPYNLIPFYTVKQYIGTGVNIWIAIMNVFGNIVIFIPLGIYLQVFKKNKRVLNCVAAVCIISLCVEAVQYIMGIGAADIDDIMLNTLGGMIGILVYRVLYFVLKDNSKVETAIILLWAFAGVCFFILMCYLRFVKRYIVKIF